MSDTHLFLYKIQPVRPEMLVDGPTPQEEQVIGEHFAYLEDLTRKGVVFLAGRTLTTGHSSFGIVIFSAEDEDGAGKVMHDDPAVQQRVMRAEFYPFRIALLGEKPKS